MLFGSDRDQLRRHFIDSWRKHLNQEAMEPLEQAIAAVIALHPEYHTLVGSGEAALGRDWHAADGETNPFLHMGLHIAIHEQLATERPPGVRDLFQRLAQQQGDGHSAEHQMMECLAETLYQAQMRQAMPDEAAYLACLQDKAGQNK